MANKANSTILNLVFAAALFSVPPGTAFADAGHHRGGGHAHGPAYSAGEPGEAKKSSRIVTVTMRETQEGRMIFEPSRVHVKRGEQVRFVLTNAGEIQHEFVLASATDNLKHAAQMQQNPDMKHEDPNAKMLDPKAKGELIWRFSKAGTFEFACLIPGHREAGMTGSVVVR